MILEVRRWPSGMIFPIRVPVGSPKNWQKRLVRRAHHEALVQRRGGGVISESVQQHRTARAIGADGAGMRMRVPVAFRALHHHIGLGGCALRFAAAQNHLVRNAFAAPAQTLEQHRTARRGLGLDRLVRIVHGLAQVADRQAALRLIAEDGVRRGPILWLAERACRPLEDGDPQGGRAIPVRIAVSGQDADGHQSADRSGR